MEHEVIQQHRKRENVPYKCYKTTDYRETETMLLLFKETYDNVSNKSPMHDVIFVYILSKA